MKKILTLFIALGAVTGVFAQYSNRPDNRDVVINNGNRTVYNDNSRYDDRFSVRDRDMAIDRINRDFDARIRDVQFNRWLRPYEKRYQVSQLEQQRRYQIQTIVDRFERSRRWKSDRRW